MMGRTHAVSGPVLALAATPALNMGLSYLGRPELAGLALVPLCVASAGGAMLSDLDHRHATVAQSLGPVTKTLAIGVETVSGGHREGTHSFIGIAFFTALTYFIAQWNPWAYGIWMAFLVAIASAAMFKSFRKGSVIAHTIVVLLLGAAVVALSGTTYLPVEPMVIGVGIGVAAHILGDMLTKQGCPVFWPFIKKHFRFASLTTGKEGEARFFVGLCVALVALVLWHVGVLEPVWNWVAPKAVQLWSALRA